MAETNGDMKAEISKPKTDRKQETHHKMGLRRFYVPILFTMVYFIVSLIYLLLIHFGFNILAGTDGKVLAFLTSPFNFLEDFSGQYKSAQQGYFFNAILTIVFLFFALIYYDFFTESKRVGTELVFWESVLASYVVSISVWAITGWPATGTSIIGFSIVAYLFLLSFFDFFRMEQRKPRPLFKDRKIIIVITTICISWLFLLSGYLLGNRAYAYHLAGGAICALLTIAIVRRR
jgi:magnesium-transporting ATPase (P-type)